MLFRPRSLLTRSDQLTGSPEAPYLALEQAATAQTPESLAWRQRRPGDTPLPASLAAAIRPPGSRRAERGVYA
jgi:hypothetical protein